MTATRSPCQNRTRRSFSFLSLRVCGTLSRSGKKKNTHTHTHRRHALFSMVATPPRPSFVYPSSLLLSPRSSSNDDDDTFFYRRFRCPNRRRSPRVRTTLAWCSNYLDLSLSPPKESRKGRRDAKGGGASSLGEAVSTTPFMAPSCFLPTRVVVVVP